MDIVNGIEARYKLRGFYVPQDIQDLADEIERPRVLLSQAANDIEDWGAYASEYFQFKHDLEGCVKRYRDIK